MTRPGRAVSHASERRDTIQTASAYGPADSESPVCVVTEAPPERISIIDGLASRNIKLTFLTSNGAARVSDFNPTRLVVNVEELGLRHVIIGEDLCATFVWMPAPSGAGR